MPNQPTSILAHLTIIDCPACGEARERAIELKAKLPECSNCDSMGRVAVSSDPALQGLTIEAPR